MSAFDSFESLPAGIAALAEELALRCPDLELRHGDRSLTAERFAERVAVLTGGMRDWGVMPGDHVAIVLRNRLEWLELWFAIARLGAVCVPVNTRFSLAETEYVLRHGRVRWLVWRPGDSDLDASALERIGRDLALSGRAVLDAAPSADDEIAFDDLRAGHPAPMREDGRALGMIQYTSGSTAFPKGAMLHNAALVRNGYGIGRAWRLGPTDRVLCSNPLFHCGGSVFAFMAGVTHQAAVELMTSWSVADAVELIAARGVTVFPGIDAAVRDLIADARATGRRLPTLRLVSTAADRDLFEAAAAMLDCEVSNVYGLTECSPNVCIGDLDDPQEIRLAKIGRPQPGTRVDIRALEGGASLPVGAVGEIVVAGPTVMEGYFDDEPATRAVFTADGFLRTGDLGELDAEGFLSYRGRAKLMIKSGGENVAIEEVESALRAHPAVADAIVVPVAHERFGEVGFAFLRRLPGAELAVDDVLAGCRSRIAGFKVPKQAVVVDDLPRSGSGKVDRRLLGERAERLFVAAAGSGREKAS